MNIVPHVAKSSRYTIGARIENKFLDLLELAYAAYFTEKEKYTEKLEKVSGCILILDTLKFFISVAWEGKIISDRQCQNVSAKLDEIGKMLGGWKNSFNNLEKKNRNL